jgi:hypothetical protein
LVDLPHYLKHPIKDLKILKPKFIPKTTTPYELADPTVGGLFPAGMPCLDFHKSLVREAYPELVK